MILLPKVYENEGGKYPEHVGKPKLSYSQYSSWKDYQSDYILQYFLGQPFKSNIFADFGTQCGQYIEAKATNTPSALEQSNLLTGDVIEWLDKNITYPENATYEEEIVVDLGEFVIQGFLDRCQTINKGVIVTDFKTGNADKKVDYYSSEAYGQTTLYSYQKKLEGFEILESKVLLLPRKGNGNQNAPLRLVGEPIEILTPYSDKRAAALFKEIKKVAKEISAAYKVVQTLNK